MTMTDRPEAARRLPAEWEAHGCVMMAWPHAATDWNYMLDDAKQCFFNIISAIARNEKVLVVGPEPMDPKFMTALFEKGVLDNVVYVDVPTDDTWARDFGPITVEDADGTIRRLDFTFNGWGGKFEAGKDNSVNAALEGKGMLDAVCKVDMVLEGGSIESDGQGTLLTTSRCLLAPTRNPHLSKARVEEMLAKELGTDHILWLDHGALSGDDTDSHIDTLARLAPGDTIIYCGPGDENDTDHEELAAMRDEIRALRTREGNPFNLIELPLPSPIYDSDGMQLPATYANYLVAPGHIYMPVYDQPAKDKLAEQMLKIAYPDREIVTVDCRALIEQHGSLHCVTMQLPKY